MAFAKGAVAGAVVGGVYGMFSDRTSVLGGAAKGALLGGGIARYGPGARSSLSAAYGMGHTSLGALNAARSRTAYAMGQDLKGLGHWADKKFATLVSNRGGK